MSAPTERHETRALLRAHLAAASGYRHLTRHCPICHRLLRLAMEPLTAPQTPCAPSGPTGPPPAPETASGAPARGTEAEASATKGDAAAAERRTRSPGDESPPAT
ncbi:DUF6274 family protein [Streptomyces sp. NPDC102441]|uniref:DUF6274 family protein n=1 Tax=Streptomyces sp. NPDC102441 TaxID=3366176 RepID=UPI00380042FF